MSLTTPSVPLLNRILAALARVLLGLGGWHVEGGLPDARKFVVITTHTSNWDWVVGLGVATVLTEGFGRLRFAWLGKDSLFRGPLGVLMRWTGGIPIDRSSSHGVVEQTIAAFRAHESLIIAIAPEGTRRKAARWRTGFYYIALGAQVPIACAFLDYKRRAGGLGLLLQPLGDIEADMARIRTFYRGVVARYPQNVSPIEVSSADAKSGRQTEGHP
jgi:1-acyl-sn-glycerol-3-phosphate acyltransferase